MSFQRTKQLKTVPQKAHIRFDRQLQNCSMESDDEFETTQPQQNE